MNLNDLINRIGIKPKEKNEALDTYIENHDKNMAGLETMLSEFSRIINDKSAPKLSRGEDEEDRYDIYYDYIYENLNIDYTLDDIDRFANHPLHYTKNYRDENSIKNVELGLFISAAINKVVKKGEKVRITTLIPLGYLFYRLKDTEAYANIAGIYFGLCAQDSKIHAEEAGIYAAYYMRNSELHVKKASHFLGGHADNSKIYADKASSNAGYDIKNSELHVKETSGRLGVEAINSKIYADKAGGNVGEGMKNSELRIYELDGDLQNIHAINKTNNIYIGEASYKRHYIRYKLSGIKVWKKQD